MKEIICCLNTFYVMTKIYGRLKSGFLTPPLSFVLAIKLEQVWNSFTFHVSSHFYRLYLVDIRSRHRRI